MRIIVSTEVSRQLMGELGYVSSSFPNDLQITSSPSLRTSKGGDIVIEADDGELVLVLMWWSQVQNVDETIIYEAYEKNENVGLLIVLDSRVANPLAWGRILEWVNIRTWDVPIAWAYSRSVSNEYHVGHYLKQVISRIQKEGVESLFTLHRRFKLEEYSPLRAFLMMTPGIGRKTSADIEEQYPTILDMLTIEDGKVVPKPGWWAKVKGVGPSKGVAINLHLGVRRVVE